MSKSALNRHAGPMAAYYTAILFGALLGHWGQRPLWLSLALGAFQLGLFPWLLYRFVLARMPEEPLLR